MSKGVCFVEDLIDLVVCLANFRVDLIIILGPVVICPPLHAEPSAYKLF